MAKLTTYADIPELSDTAALFHDKSEYTYIINAEKYQQTGELDVKRVLKEDLLPEASTSYVFFKREGCHGYPLNEQDLTIKSSLGYVGPFQMNSAACNAFLKHMKENHPETAPYITAKGTSGYMNFVKKYPDKEKLIQTIENYALDGYFDGRIGKPDTLAKNLAKQLNKTDENGTPDATRLPLHVIASLPTGVIARGNGRAFDKNISKMTENNIDKHCISWISSNLGRNAYNQLKQVDYLTPEIIEQYQTMNLSGAEKLQQKYAELVRKQENKIIQNINTLGPASIAPKDNLNVSLAIPEELKLKIEPDNRQKKLLAKLQAKETKKKLKEKEETPSKTTVKKEQPTSTVTNNDILSRIKAEHGRL
ncbi:MAG: hypothetical protein J6C85_07100 [Alphaproteobacteria bacterium]|nr:hypothetical protein [Alphaproteobacteria bacterium]